MRSREEYEAVKGLVEFGLNDCQVARLTGVPRGTVRYMRTSPRAPWQRMGRTDDDCPVCGSAPLDEKAYSYLLGLYLGDGCISLHPRGVYKLRITLDQKYPDIIESCSSAMSSVRSRSPMRVGRTQSLGCVEVRAHWKHWPCLFPQHGPGPKWKREIRLVGWQVSIARTHPRDLLRGLIHSDGSRDLNWVKGKSYPRYQFSNNSADIQAIFCRCCEKLGVHWTQPYWKTLAVSRRRDVEFLDSFIGPKS